MILSMTRMRFCSDANFLIQLFNHQFFFQKFLIFLKNCVKKFKKTRFFFDSVKKKFYKKHLLNDYNEDFLRCKFFYTIFDHQFLFKNFQFFLKILLPSSRKHIFLWFCQEKILQKSIALMIIMRFFSDANFLIPFWIINFFSKILSANSRKHVFLWFCQKKILQKSST